MPDTVVYLYAVSRGVPADVLDGLSGVADRPARVVGAGGLEAVVGSVPAEEFDPATAERRSEDIEWVARVARAHHRVVDAVGGAAVVAPMSMGTVFHDDDRVRDVLGERATELAAVLDGLAGRAEWGVKAFAPVAPEPRVRASTGTEYLRARRDARDRAGRADDRVHAAAEVVHRAASATAVDTRLHRVHDPALTGRTEQMVLNGAYLVDRGRTTAWRAAVEEACGELAVEITGPWVPYSFTAGPPS